MIKYSAGSVEVNGSGIDILAELGMLTEYIISTMQKDIPRDIVVGAVKRAIDVGIEFSGREDSEARRTLEVAEILKNMAKVGKTVDAD